MEVFIMFDLIPFEHRNAGLFDFFNHFDDDFFNSTQNSFAPCRTDIRDEGNQYVLEAELPGFSKEEINVNVENDCMTLTAQHKEDSEQKDNAGNYIRRERRMNSLSRSFDISGINTEKITASFENGVLTMHMPKNEETKPLPKQITIQ
jgi:HSP20 family protein